MRAAEPAIVTVPNDQALDEMDTGEVVLTVPEPATIAMTAPTGEVVLPTTPAHGVAETPEDVWSTTAVVGDDGWWKRRPSPTWGRPPAVQPAPNANSPIAHNEVIDLVSPPN